MNADGDDVDGDDADSDDTSAKEEFSAEPIRVWKMPYCLFDLGGAHLSGWILFYQNYTSIPRPDGFA